MAAEENWDDIPQNGEAHEEEEMIRICINWAGLLEPIDLSPLTTVDELAGFIFSASECAVPEHKLFIFKGMLLPVDAMLCDVRVSDGSVLHLVLNDDPYQGRPLFVKCEAGDLKTIFCGADFYIEDVKEELSCFPDQARVAPVLRCHPTPHPARPAPRSQTSSSALPSTCPSAS
jgi:hypothetical protein